MTSDEFNEKYAQYLGESHYGMAFDNEEIIALCDEYFQNWIDRPGFKYYQIKSKFGLSRVYCDKVDTTLLENKINKIMKKWAGD